jgi:hypothetical protein
MSTYRPRNIRMGEIWDQASEFAQENDANMSDLVRVALEQFLASPDAPLALEAGRTRARRSADSPKDE